MNTTLFIAALVAQAIPLVFIVKTVVQGGLNK
jgi:hypothetical protein